MVKLFPGLLGAPSFVRPLKATQTLDKLYPHVGGSNYRSLQLKGLVGCGVTCVGWAPSLNQQGYFDQKDL